MVGRPEFGKGAVVEDARERSEDSAVCDDEDGVRLVLEREDDLVEKTAQAVLDSSERLTSVAGHIGCRILECRLDVVVRERADGRSLIRSEVNLVKTFVDNGHDAVRCGENLGGVSGAAVGACKRMVESETGGDESISRQFGLADAACVDVNFDDAALDAHLAVPVRLAVPDEENVHRCVLYHPAGPSIFSVNMV